MPSCIFVGPSIPSNKIVETARKANVQILPPARNGDVSFAAKTYDKILLIDGVMVYDYPPTPREIATVLEGGTTVWGAASLGALRAVELLPLGIVGSGWVFNAYQSRKVFSDDELLCIFDAETQVAYTVPLINIRYGLELEVIRNPSLKDWAADTISELKTIYFEDRNEATLKLILQARNCSEKLIKKLFSKESDIKCHDSLVAISKFCTL